MGIRQMFFGLIVALAAHSLVADEILVGVEFIPQRTMAVLLTPVVIPDLVTVKAAFEYRLHRKINLVIPLEAKFMNYRKLINWYSDSHENPNNFPKDLYDHENKVRPKWNFDYSHRKISTGIGAKVFPFGESMTNAFFIKTLFLVGVERFNAFSAEGIRDGAVFTHALTLGYNWVAGDIFSFAIEVGEEYDYHTNPMEDLVRPWFGFSPLFQLSLGVTL